jgi:adenosylcobinamide-phosphate synthase
VALEFHPQPWFLATGVLLDLLLGDPHYPAHPVRLMGRTLSRFEDALRNIGFDGYGGGVLLLVMLSLLWAGGVCVLLQSLPVMAAAILHVFLVYSLLALRDLLRHGWDVEKAAQRNDLVAARIAISKLVGRDTSKMDLQACRRAAIESLSENLTDGFVSAIFWYALAGLPGLILFKIVSTMDSMVGYKIPRYLRFGWCGARTDDLMNWIPARLTWLLLAGLSFLLPGFSGRKSFLVGWTQHAIVPGPNSGWSEAAMAGSLSRRLIGPIWAQGQLVTEVWLGDSADPAAGESQDLRRAAFLTALTGIVFAIATIGLLKYFVL